jgi:rhomboid protease GluP
MHINEQYTLYSLAHRFVKDYKYNVLYINEQLSEVWLEKKDQKKSRVIRFIQRGFDWKNHLKKDVAGVFQRAKNLKQHLSSKNVEIFNIYVTTYQPIDSWEELKKPMRLKEKNPMWMYLYYLDESDYVDEYVRLQEDIGMSEDLEDLQIPDEGKKQKIHYYKTSLKNVLKQQQEKVESIFTYGKPVFTYILIAISLVLFLLLELNGGSSDIQTLIDYGAKYNPAIILDGEWWRIISSMFLHIGLLHMVMNMIALYFLGTIVERIFGSGRFLFIYMLSGIGGGLASFAVSDSVAAGASGAIFGLFGALLFFGVHYKRLFFRTMGQGVLLIIAINLVLGFTVAQIDMAAHLGGLVTGFVASAMCHLPHKKEKKFRLLAAVGYILILSGLTALGLYNSEHSQLFQLTKAEHMIADADYEEVIVAADKGLQLEGDLEAYLFFQRGYAYLEKGDLEQATKDFEKSIEYEPLPESYYNLALLYEQAGNRDQAEEMIINAYEMRPEEEQFIQAYEEITGNAVPD